MSDAPSRKAFLLRLDPAVAAAIEAMAAQELRSVNALSASSTWSYEYSFARWRSAASACTGTYCS